MTAARLLSLVDDLRGLPAERSCVEFKHNNNDPNMVGKLISALANAAWLADQPFAYVLCGVQDSDHAAVGTAFDPASQLQGNQPFEFWLAQRLQPSISFTFRTIDDYRGVRLVLLEIPAAAPMPVEFDRVAYLRIGSATPPLSDYPERLQALWAMLRPCAWEAGTAAQFISADDVLAKLDFVRYFDLTGQPVPDNDAAIFERLAAERLIQPDVGSHWNVTNLGAILLARQLSQFQTLARKGIRFVAYDGDSRASTVIHRRDNDQRSCTCHSRVLVNQGIALLAERSVRQGQKGKTGRR